ncbi:MAG: gliding motility-associated ABC transporter substrate-binding protein GldG [Bacteroidetes bacterium]|nr:gliding motility-associated ABC transporter substrate-binding protein GldG [Bacteroidota bacterium]
MNKNVKHIKNLIFVIVGIILLNVLGNYFYKRFDLTQDKRFTLSQAAKNTIANVDSPIVVEVFLKGNFPSEFKRLQVETRQLLEEFESFNSFIKYRFIDPLENEEGSETIRKKLLRLGLNPAQVEVRQSGKITTEQVYPWALAYYNEKTVKIQLLKNQLGATSEERVNNSIQNLEYAFADGFNKLVHPKERKIAVLKGNGELEDKFVVDFFKTLKEYYYIAPFTLDSAAVSPLKTLKQLNGFDLIVIANPTEAFTDREKYILDQYTMDGGASLWLIDAVVFNKDSISGNDFGYGKELNLSDFFFKYGIRINPDLIKDVYAAPIVLASGTERESQFSRYPWFYSPLSSSANNHPIVTNIEAVKFEYVSSIDTLPNNIKKTILLSSSPISKIVGMPVEIDITKEINKNLKIVNEGPLPFEYNSGEIPLAILLEGEFSSVYTNRVKPFKIENDKSNGVSTKMIVISDGSLIKNQLRANRPLELGFDKWTNTFYGNKEFLLNSVNYLLDDSGLINIRTKKIAIPFLDSQKTEEKRGLWQLVNLLLPLVILAIFGFIYNYYRKRKYSRIC